MPLFPGVFIRGHPFNGMPDFWRVRASWLIANGAACETLPYLTSISARMQRLRILLCSPAMLRGIERTFPNSRYSRRRKTPAGKTSVRRGRSAGLDLIRNHSRSAHNRAVEHSAGERFSLMGQLMIEVSLRAKQGIERALKPSPPIV